MTQYRFDNTRISANRICLIDLDSVFSPCFLTFHYVLPLFNIYNIPPTLSYLYLYVCFNFTTAPVPINGLNHHLTLPCQDFPTKKTAAKAAALSISHG